MFAVCLFIYETLDAIDGKHARRLGLSSPLGELFDHGMDSVSTFLVSTATAIALCLGDDPVWFFSTVVVSMVMFYLAHWAAYATGTMKFGLFDVTEVQWCAILTMSFTSFFGTEIWYTNIYGWLQLRHVYLIVSYIGVVLAFSRLVSFIIDSK